MQLIFNAKSVNFLELLCAEEIENTLFTCLRFFSLFFDEILLDRCVGAVGNFIKKRFNLIAGMCANYLTNLRAFFHKILKFSTFFGSPRDTLIFELPGFLVQTLIHPKIITLSKIPQFRIPIKCFQFEFYCYADLIVHVVQLNCFLEYLSRLLGNR